MYIFCFLRFFDINRTAIFANSFSSAKGIPSILNKFVPFFDIGILLLEGISIYWNPRLCALNRFQKREPRNSCFFRHKIIRRQVLKPKKLPPNSLFFTTMPVKKVGKKPSRMLLFRPPYQIYRHIMSKFFDKCQNFFSPFIELFLWC